jgi:hypothetical protein
MFHLPKPPSQFINLFWDFRVVGMRRYSNNSKERLTGKVLS